MQRFNIILLALVVSISSVFAAGPGPQLDPNKQKYGFMGFDGKWKVKPQFESITPSGDGYQVNKNGKVGYYDTFYEQVVKPDYQSVVPTGHSTYLVQKNERWQLIDEKGKSLVKGNIVDVKLTPAGNVCMTSDKNEAGLVSASTGIESIAINKSPYSSLSPLVVIEKDGCELDILTFTDAGGQGLISQTGQIILAPGYYEEYQAVSGVNGKMVYGLTHGKKALIRFGGRSNEIIALNSLAYDNVLPFDGYSVVSDNGKKGVIDDGFVEIVPVKYDEVLPAYWNDNQSFILTAGNKKGWKSGAYLVKPAFDKVDYMAAEKQLRTVTDGITDYYFVDGRQIYTNQQAMGHQLRWVKRSDGRSMLVDKDMNFLTSAENAVAEPLGHMIIIKNSGEKRLLNGDGQTVKQTVREYAFSPADTTAAVCAGSGVGIAYVYNANSGKLIQEIPLVESGALVVEPDSTVTIMPEAAQGLAALLHPVRERVQKEVEKRMAEEAERLEAELAEAERVAEEERQRAEEEQRRREEEYRREMAKPRAEIHKVWVDHNVFENGYKGMRIHVKFSTYNMLNHSGECNAYFYFANGTALKDFNGRYKTTSGYVSTGKRINPNYENAIFNDLQMFIPYDELHINKNEKTAKCKFKIGVFNYGDEIANSGYYNFTWSAGSTPAPNRNKSSKSASSGSRNIKH